MNNLINLKNITMKDDIMYLIDVVDSLNDCIWGEEGENEENFEHMFSLRYSPIFQMIYFDDTLLWHSEFEDEYEDLEEFCKDRLREINENLISLNDLLE